MRTIYILFFFLFLRTTNCFAQNWEAGLFGGASGYIGDINPVQLYKVNDPALGASLKYNFDGYWSVGLNVIEGRIHGDDANSNSAYQRLRNLSFHSMITEISAQVEFNFLNYLPGVRHALNKHRITPFLFTGIGGVFFSPYASYQGVEYALEPLETEGVAYPRSAITIPYGAGVKYNIKRNLTLLFQIGYRTAFTSYLDDVHGSYPSQFNSALSHDLSDRSGEVNNGVDVGVGGTQRGDLRNNDTYMFVGFGLAFRFISNKCFSF